MRKTKTAKQEIIDFLKKNPGYEGSCRTLGEHFGFHYRTIHKYLTELQKFGYLSIEKNKNSGRAQTSYFRLKIDDLRHKEKTVAEDISVVKCSLIEPSYIIKNLISNYNNITCIKSEHLNKLLAPHSIDFWLRVFRRNELVRIKIECDKYHPNLFFVVWDILEEAVLLIRIEQVKNILNKVKHNEDLVRRIKPTLQARLIDHERFYPNRYRQHQARKLITKIISRKTTDATKSFIDSIDSKLGNNYSCAEDKITDKILAVLTSMANSSRGKKARKEKPLTTVEIENIVQDSHF